MNYCLVEAANDVRYKSNTDTPGISNSIYYFPKDVALWPKWTRFDRPHREDFYSLKLSAFCSVPASKTSGTYH